MYARLYPHVSDHYEQKLPKQYFCCGVKSYTNSVLHKLMHLTPILKKSSVTELDLRDCSSIQERNFSKTKLKLQTIKIFGQSDNIQFLQIIQYFQEMPFVPKNARAILKSAALQKQYFLKPFGLSAPINKNLKVIPPPKKFVDLDIILHRPGKEVSESTLTFKCDQTLSKPEIKQYISKLYNLNVEKVNTARFMGKVHREMEHKPKKDKNWKKAFVMTTHKFDPFLNQLD